MYSFLGFFLIKHYKQHQIKGSTQLLKYKNFPTNSCKSIKKIIEPSMVVRKRDKYLDAQRTKIQPKFMGSYPMYVHRNFCLVS